MPPTHVQLVNVLLAEKKAKAKEAAITKPQGLHSMLKVHDLQGVPPSVKDLLRGQGAGTKGAGKGAAAAAAPAAEAAPGKRGGLLAPRK